MKYMIKWIIVLASCLLMINVSNASDTIEDAGDILEVLIPASAAFGTVVHNDLAGVRQLACVGLTTLITVEGLKYNVDRERPNGHDHSFPSGHTAAAFAGAGFLQMRYGWWYGVPAYALAAFTGYSRVESHNHWTSDVLAGAAIGIGANLIFTSKYAESVSISPYIESKRKEQGITVSASLS